MPENDDRPLFTVANLFTVRDPQQASGFEDAFADHVEFMHDQPGFVGHQAARVVSGACSYVNAGWWRSPADFTAVRQSTTFRSHATAFGAMVDVVVIPSGNLRRSVPSGRLFAAEPTVALQLAEVTGDPRRVLASWTALLRTWRQEPDDSPAQARNLGYAVSRVMTHPERLVVLTWWDGSQGVDARLAAATPPGLAVSSTCRGPHLLAALGAGELSTTAASA